MIILICTKCIKNNYYCKKIQEDFTKNITFELDLPPH